MRGFYDEDDNNDSWSKVRKHKKQHKKEKQKFNISDKIYEELDDNNFDSDIE